MKKSMFLIISLMILAPSGSYCQKAVPRLVVGIVVDQMRPDYLTRFQDHFSKDGFSRLMNDGFTLWNVRFNYVPTYTGPGHASLFSGTTPGFHGITGNNIYDRSARIAPYCVSDTFRIVGNTSAGKADGPSPKRLLTTSICDELKLCTGNRAKCMALSLKDRAAILAGGHLSDYAIWLDQRSGNFVTSSYYSGNLPEWTSAFNRRRLCETYAKTPWSQLLGEEAYADCVVDTSFYAVDRDGVKRMSVFPHDLTMKQGSVYPAYTALYCSPMGSSLLTDLALEAIRNGGLGMGTATDFLIVSYSSPDAVGHLYGPDSREMMDTYLRLDRDLGRLITLLDQQIGKDQYVLFLTADHAVAEIPKHLQKRGIPAGYIDFGKIMGTASAYLDKVFFQGKWIDTLINDQVYLNRDLILEKGLDLELVQDRLAEFLTRQPGIAFAYTAASLNKGDFSTFPGKLVKNGYHPSLSGDVMLVMEPEHFEYGKDYLTEHGSVYDYDTHVPMIWYGKGISRGESWNPHEITDLAPTLSRIMRIKYTSANLGNPIGEIFREK